MDTSKIVKSVIFFTLLFCGLSIFAQKDSPKVLSKTPSSLSQVKTPTQGTLVVFSTPPESEVFVNSRYYGTTTSNGYLEKPILLKPGKYSLEVKHLEYENFQKKCEIIAGKSTQISVTLNPKFGFIILTFSKAMTNEQIKLDGKILNKNDYLLDSEQSLRIKTSIGEHKIEVSSPKYITFSSSLNVISTNPSIIPVVFNQKAATLLVKSQVGTRVYVNGKNEGIIPQTGQLLVNSLVPDEKNTILLEHDGFEKYETIILGNAEKETLLEAQLTLLPTSSEFADNFEGGLAFWDAPKEWKAEGGVLTVGRSNKIGMLKNKHFCDCEIVFGLRLLSDKGAAWIVHAINENSYYLFNLNGPSGLFPNKLQTYVCNNGKYNVNEPVIPPLPIVPPLNFGETYRVRIRIQGNIIQHWITPTKTGEELSIGLFKDTENKFPCGNVGFVTLENGTFQVNGFVVEPIQNK